MCRFIGLLCSFLLMVVLTGCDNSSDQQTSTIAGQAVAPPGAIELLFPYGSEKKAWLEAATARFNEKRITLDDGTPIFVRAQAMGSGELVTDVLDGSLQAHIVSPASNVFVELGNSRSRARNQGDAFEPGPNLVLSPVVIAMWQPMAEALGWPDRPIGWGDIVALAQDPQGWRKFDQPQWGAFKFGHTHPEYSNSGIISVLAEVYAGAGKQRGLTREDLQRTEVAAYLRNIEQSVVHYGRSTGFFGDKMFTRGPAFLSAAVLYENMVIESYDPKHSLPFPVVAIYPTEGTFWSDHPINIVNRDWVNDQHRAAAKKYIDFLRAPEQQRDALTYGFRPGDPAIPLGAPLDAAHGVDPNQPTTTLEVPSGDVIEGVLELWKQNKKASDVILVIDKSGSMRGEKINAAKQGAMELVNLLGDEDKLTLIEFNSEPIVTVDQARLADGRAELTSKVNGLFASGGTALYDALSQAHRQLQPRAGPTRISAIVVLSDGEDRNSRLELNALLSQLRPDPEATTVRVFTIAYGDEADTTVLGKIAEQTDGKSYKGTTDNIRDVFRDISTFF